jgi:L-lactate dehydrogenase (cytochrome)
MQLYVDKKRHKSEALVEKINGHKQLKAIFVTVDASAPGKREKDERLRSAVAVVRKAQRWRSRGATDLLCWVYHAGIWYIWWENRNRQQGRRDWTICRRVH